MTDRPTPVDLGATEATILAWECEHVTVKTCYAIASALIADLRATREERNKYDRQLERLMYFVGCLANSGTPGVTESIIITDSRTGLQYGLDESFETHIRREARALLAELEAQS